MASFFGGTLTVLLVTMGATLVDKWIYLHWSLYQGFTYFGYSLSMW